MGSRIDRLQLETGPPGAFVAMVASSALATQGGFLQAIGAGWFLITPLVVDPTTDSATGDPVRPSRRCAEVPSAC